MKTSKSRSMSFRRGGEETIRSKSSGRTDQSFLKRSVAGAAAGANASRRLHTAAAGVLINGHNSIPPTTANLFDSNGNGRASTTIGISNKFEAPQEKINRSQSSPPSYLKQPKNYEDKQHVNYNRPFTCVNNNDTKMKHYFSRRNRSSSFASSSDTRFDLSSNSLTNHYGSRNSFSLVKAAKKSNKSSFPVSETKASFNVSKSYKRNFASGFSSTSRIPVRVVVPPPGAAVASQSVLELLHQFDKDNDNVNVRHGRRQRSEDNIVGGRGKGYKGSGRNYESDHPHTMKGGRSELSLLEQKRLQWAKEKEEQNDLWSPWGRRDLESTPLDSLNQIKSSSILNKSTLSVSPPSTSPQLIPAQMQASYPPPTNVVSSSYIANLHGGLGSPTYSQSHSDQCYLPPINSTIAKQPRQKAKVWNVEFQQEDYRYEANNGHHQASSLYPPSSHHNHRPSVPNNSSRGTVVTPRKASLPANYPCYEGGDGYLNNNSSNYQHQQYDRVEGNIGGNVQHRVWGSPTEEEAFTSGYYSSENNNNGDEQLRESGGTKEIRLKPTSRERSYQEEVTVHKAIAIRNKQEDNDGSSEGNPPAKMVVRKIYAQNGEVLMERSGNEEVVVNSLTVEMNGNSSRSTASNSNNALPRNHAMRSSLTIGVDARAVDAYYENDKRKKEQWLNELDKQREEQRLRKMMEKEERRPRWGDRGIGVGHFWEPSASENSHLPAPPLTSRSYKSSGGGSLTRSESHAGTIGGGDSYISHPSHYPHHSSGQSQTPPAWLERSLTRMQSSKSQPNLHDPEYIADLDYHFDSTNTNHGGNIGAESKSGNHHNNNNDYDDEEGEGNNQHRLNLVSSRSLNQSAIDLRIVAEDYSPGDSSDRTFLRGQNVPIDPDILSEREKKRLANQEHLEALKKQIEERQQQQKEEKEQRQKEEHEQEIRMAKQREVELARLEMEKRGRMPVNGDMPNSVEESTMSGATSPGHHQPKKMSSKNDHSHISHREPNEEKDIEIVQRQSVMVHPTGGDDDKTTTESSSASYSNTNFRRQSRQDQGVMTISTDQDGSDQALYERTLTPSIQRSRSLSLNRSSREFGTQTELSDGSTSSGGSSCDSVGSKNSNKNRSHNSLLDKKAMKEQQSRIKESKKTEERPRWGSNPVKKQYIKQSEKDPNYISRMKRRQERLKRMEDERSARGDTGTESEDVSIPFHRIRQRRNEGLISPQRKVKGIAPLKAIVSFLGAAAKGKEQGNSSSSSVSVHNKMADGSTSLATSPKRSRNVAGTGGGRKVISNRSPRRDDSVPCPHSHSMKNAKSESNLNKETVLHSNIIDRNFGSIAGVNTVGTGMTIGTSEESSGFSTPFLPRRDLGTGSTESGSGTTGSGSGVQSPDLIYEQRHHNSNSHAYQRQIARGTREERKFTKMTSGRDNIHSITTVASAPDVASSNSKEFMSIQQGFINQRDFDEMPVKSAKLQSNFNINGGVTAVGELDRRNNANEPQLKNNCKPTMSSKNSLGRNRSLSPKRNPPSPVKLQNKVQPNNVDKKGNLKSKRGQSFDAHVPLNETANNNAVPECLPSVPLPIPIPPGSPPVPALLKKMQMGLQPDESGRISSLPTEFPDILAPLPSIPLRLISPVNPPTPSSRLSSATSLASSTSAGKIDIDIAVTPRNNPEILRFLEVAEERIKQRQLTAILATGNDSAKSRRSFEADIGNISINLEPIAMYPNQENGVLYDEGEEEEEGEIELPASSSARLSIRSHPTLSTNSLTARSSETARHEAFIASILSRKEVKDQLSARESELSEKGIIEFSIRLPSNSSGDDFLEDYKDPLLTERRRNTVHWLYGGGQNQIPPKQAILTNLANLKKGISPLQKENEWKVHHSDSEYP